MMNTADHAEDAAMQEQADRPARDPHEPARLRFADRRRGEIVMLVGAVLMGALLAFGTTRWGSSSWPHQACAWLGVLSILLFSGLLAGNLFLPQAVTARRVRVWTVLLLGIAGLAILCAVLGFFV